MRRGILYGYVRAVILHDNRAECDLCSNGEGDMAKGNERGNHGLTIVLIVGLLVGVLICLYRISSGSPTPSETLLLSELLTLFSILGSWIASRYYSEFDFNRNLRLFAHKAAEKVTNLSKELDRLSAVLQDELKAEQYATSGEALLARSIRIEDAIHIIRTLKSVNDGSLSDWQGVIGEELSAKLEEKEKREQSLRQLLERFESLEEVEPSLAPEADEGGETTKLRSEVNSIREDLRTLAGQVSGLPIRQPRARPGRQLVEAKCPLCSEIIRYRIKERQGAIKPVKCVHCGASLYSRQLDGEVILRQRVPSHEVVICPVCAEKLDVMLDPVPGASQDLACPKCKNALKAIRKQQGVRVKVHEAGEKPSEVTEQRVKEAMGPQPWPPGKARAVSEELGLPVQVVSSIVKQLIDRGEFKVQVNGRLYVPDDAHPS